VSHYSPGGEEMGRIELPMVNITSLTFGGKEYKDLYITSSEGTLFRCRMETAGRPESLSAIQ
jgi:sugar lactone lactonase YvrE